MAWAAVAVPLATAAAGATVAQTLPDPWSPLAQFGVAGILGALLIRRYEAELATERAERQRLEAALATLTGRVTEDIIPLLGDVQRGITDAVRQGAEHMARVSEQLARLERGD